MDMFPEISWLQFSQLPQIKRLPIQEQIQRYNILVEEGFLQQEDLFYILQEDGSKIYVTVEI